MPPVVALVAVAVQAYIVSQGFTFLVTAFLVLAVGAISSFAMMALTPKPKSGLGVGGITRTIREPAQSWRIIYGTRRVGGNLVFAETTDFYTDKNSALYMLIVIAGHEIDGVDGWMIDDTAVTLDGDGFVEQDPWADLQAIRITLHTGTTTQTADQNFLDENVPSFNSNMRLRGRAYFAVRLRWFGPLWPSGIPNITAIARGKKLFDPRDSSTIFNDNPALGMYDYMTDTEYGLGILSANIDDTAIQAAANECDESVSLSSGGSESRYTLNGAFDLDIAPNEILRGMLSSMAGTLVHSGGVWFVRAGSYVAPTVDLDENSLVGPLNVTTKIARRELFNRAKGKYASPENQWQPSDFPPVLNASYLAQDNNEQIWQDFEFDFTTSSATAQRLAKIQLERVRQQITVSAPFNLVALNMLGGATVGLTNTRMGWSNKVFDVSTWKFVSRPGGTIGIDAVLRETASTVYDWNSGEETVVDPAPNTNLPDPFDIGAPTGLSVLSGTDQLFVAGDGTVVSTIAVSWTAPLEAFIDLYEVQWKKSADSDFSGVKIPGVTTEYRIEPVDDGVDYDVRVRAVTTLGSEGAYATESNHTVIGKTEVPSNVSSFGATQNGNLVVFRWTGVTDVDLAGYEIRRQSSAVTFVFDTAIEVTETTRGTQVTTAVVPPGTWNFGIKAVDTSGNKSTNATTTNLLLTNVLDVIEIRAQAPDWSLGTKVNVVAHHNGLLLNDDQTLADGNNYDVFDNFNQNPATDSIYTGEIIDLGKVGTVRIWADLVYKSFSTSLPGSAKLQARFGDSGDVLMWDGDDSTLMWDADDTVLIWSGWSEWLDWSLGQESTQFVQMRILLFDRPLVSVFTEYVDVLPVTETGSLTVAASGTAVVFTKTFFATPVVTASPTTGSALIATVSNITQTGFDINVFNTGGTDVGGAANWSATTE